MNIIADTLNSKASNLYSQLRYSVDVDNLSTGHEAIL